MPALALELASNPAPGAPESAPGWIPIERALIRSLGRLKVTSEQWLFLSAVLSYVDQRTGWAWPSRETIADVTGMSESRVSAHVTALKGRGFLKVRRRGTASQMYHLGGLFRAAGIAVPKLWRWEAREPEEGLRLLCFDVAETPHRAAEAPSNTPESMWQKCDTSKNESGVRTREAATAFPDNEDAGRSSAVGEEGQTLFGLSLCDERGRELIERLREAPGWTANDAADAKYAERLLKDYGKKRSIDWLLNQAERFRLYQTEQAAQRAGGKKSARVYVKLMIAFRDWLNREIQYEARGERERALRRPAPANNCQQPKPAPAPVRMRTEEEKRAFYAAVRKERERRLSPEEAKKLIAAYAAEEGR
jgi:DNA-binding transcriptional ArsR family regulator